MSKKLKYRIFTADFETSVYKGQTETEVWAAALVELGTEQVYIFNSIESFFDIVYNLLKKDNVKIYFHNLKFDGSFIIDHWIRDTDFTQAYYLEDDSDPYSAKWVKTWEMENGTYKYLISDMGVWYSMTLKLHGHLLEIADSYKLLPFSVENISKSFETKHKKLAIEYEGERHKDQKISTEERVYIRNDVLVMKEALEIMFEEGHKKMTIGSCCLEEYQKIISWPVYKQIFPDLTKFTLDKETYGASNADQYIRRAFRGGWCYLAKGKEGKVFERGITLDVNSLYPSMMISESGNRFPVGEPVFWSGDYIPDQALREDMYYFIRVRTSFRIKKNFLPTIQIKNSLLYRQNEYLETSEFQVKDKRYEKVRIGDRVYDERVTLTLTMTDWELIKDHYDLVNTEILDGCYFQAKTGIFDDYICKYREIKMRETGPRRTLAKLYLNNLYGKTAANPNGGYKIAYLREDDQIGFYTVPETDRSVVYIPVGAVITSYARNFTIRAAQQNYYGPDRPGFIYADTDSLHLDLEIQEVTGVELSDTEFLKWKHESSWDRGIFLRQKTYVEIEDKNVLVTACGMGKRCKELIRQQLEPDPAFEPRTPEEEKFMAEKLGLEDIKIGLTIPSNLKQKRMKGGVVLVEDYFHLR